MHRLLLRAFLGMMLAAPMAMAQTSEPPTPAAGRGLGDFWWLILVLIIIVALWYYIKKRRPTETI